MTKSFYLYDRFFESNRNFTTEHVKIVITPGFLVIFVQKSSFFKVSLKFSQVPYFFSLNCQIPGLVATLSFFE